MTRRRDGTGARAESEAALRAVRAEIDAVDVELLALLARRTRLALRAGEVKRALGRGVVDRVREAELVADRRVRAASLGLDADLVEGILRAVVRLARSAQRASRVRRGGAP